MNTVGLVLLIITFLILLMIVFCLFIKIRLVASFSKRKNEKFNLSFSLELFGGRIKKNIPLVPKKKRKKSKSEKLKIEDENITLSFRQKVKKYYGIFLRISQTWARSKRKVRKRIMAEKICFNLSFGTGDAAHTGILTGSLWAATYNVIAFIANFIRVTEPQISINPSYDEEILDFDGECILKISLANIITILTIIAVNYYFTNKKLSKKEKAAINNVNTN